MLFILQVAKIVPMGPGIISLMLAVGATAWIYAKFMRRTGGLGTQSIILAGILGFFIFIISFLILRMVLPE